METTAQFCARVKEGDRGLPERFEMSIGKHVACWVLHKSLKEKDNCWHFLGDEWPIVWEGLEKWAQKTAREYERPILVKFGDEFYEFLPNSAASEDSVCQ